VHNPILSNALAYCERGWSVLPTKRADKKPALRGWSEFQRRRATEGELRGWFGDGEANVSVITGEVSGGLCVRDFDAEDSYARWADANPLSAKTLPTVATGRPGGHHVYFGANREVREAISLEAGKTGHGKITLGDGELSIGSGSYVQAPPSIHPNGSAYEWVVPLGCETPVVDPRSAGLLKDWSPVQPDSSTPNATESTEAIISVFSGISALSVALDESHSVLSVDLEVEEAIRKTLPAGGGQRNDLEFQFARELKSIPRLAGKDASELKVLVRSWYDAALPFIGTKDWETTWFTFLEAWGNVKFAAGEDVADQCFQEVIRHEPPRCAEGYESKKLRLLVSLCHMLQQKQGERPFFLSCRTAARLLTVDPKTASLWLRGLCADGVLRVAERPPRGSLRANRYQFIGAI